MGCLEGLYITQNLLNYIDIIMSWIPLGTVSGLGEVAQDQIQLPKHSCWFAGEIN